MMQIYAPQNIDATLIKKVAKWLPPEKPREIRDAAEALILRHQPSGYLGLYVQIGRGKRERICDARTIIDTSKPLTFAQARARARILRGRSAEGTDFQAQRQAAKAIPTFERYIEDTYGPWWVENRREGPENIARIRHQFFAAFGRTPLDQITPDKMDNWRTKALKRIKPETVNRHTTRLKSALSRAKKWRIIPESPLAGYELAEVDKNKRELRALTEDEERVLREALERRDATIAAERASGNAWRERRGYALLPLLDGHYPDCLTPAGLVSLETGLRRGELFALTWDRIDLDDAVINVKGATTKTYETREIPLNATAVAVFRKWKLQQGRPEKGLVFPGMKGNSGVLRRAFTRCSRMPRLNVLRRKGDSRGTA